MAPKTVKYLICIAALLQGAYAAAKVNAQDFGAKGDSLTDDTRALQAALTSACETTGSLYIPEGAYNISAPLIPACAMSISGDGAARTVIRQTVQKTANHGIITTHSLTVQDLAINTAQLLKDYGMAAVFRKDTASPASGQTFTFLRYNSSGFNFALDVAGTSTSDQLGAVTIQDCDLSTGSAWGAVAQPVNVRTAASVLAEHNTITGDLNGDHGIYLIGVRKVMIRDNTIANIQNSAVKILNGGYCGRTPGCPPDTGQDYSSWTIENNRITKAAMAMAIFLYGTTELPALNISRNQIGNIFDFNPSDGGAIYIDVNDTAVMDHISLTANTYSTISFCGIYLVTAGQGSIRTFEDREDKFMHWSVAAPGVYPAISSNGAGFDQAITSELFMDPQGTGRAKVNFEAVARVTSPLK